jgi:hypothetical protein
MKYGIVALATPFLLSPFAMAGNWSGFSFMLANGALYAILCVLIHSKKEEI